jgi:hypothetical protein
MSTLSQFFGSSSANTVPVEVLIVGGGGGAGQVTSGGSNYAAGGGGSGQLIYNLFPLTKGITFTITVGSGGALQATGNNSSLVGANGFSCIASGGGAGGDSSGTFVGAISGFGSSGGAGTSFGNVGLVPGSTGRGVRTDTSTGFTSFVGAGKGAPAFYTGSGYYGGGGGGAGGDAPTPTATNNGTGGAGLACSITGSSITYATGGANNTGAIGAANTGNGGGGLPSSPHGAGAGAGGSGILVIAYPNTYAAPATITGTYTQPTRSGYRVYQFTGNGTITFSS